MLVLLSNSIQYFPLISVQYFPLSQLFENDFTEVETIGRGTPPWVLKAVTACHSGLCVGAKCRGSMRCVLRLPGLIAFKN